MGASRQGLLGDQVQTTATTSCHTMGAAEALGLTPLTHKKRAPVPGEPHSCTTVPVSQHPPPAQPLRAGVSSQDPEPTAHWKLIHKCERHL